MTLKGMQRIKGTGHIPRNRQKMLHSPLLAVKAAQAIQEQQLEFAKTRQMGRSEEVGAAILDRMGAITRLPPRGSGRVRLQAIIYQTLFLPYNDFWITDPERN